MSDRTTILTPRLAIQVAFFIVVVPLLPILISGRWRWWEAWVYAAINTLGFVVSRWLAARRDPGILAERARSMQCENAESWDKVLAPLVGLGGGAIPLVVGLDALFGWSPELPMSWKLAALAAIAVGYSIGAYALVENRFFSGVARIQSDRDHHVVTSGPYGWVRHPGYAGALLTYLATPVFLEALTAFVPAVLLTVLLVIRTAKEDSMLREKLSGYEEYASRVRYRLVPGVW